MPNLINENFKKTHSSGEKLGRISNNIPGYTYFTHTSKQQAYKTWLWKNTKKKKKNAQLSQENGKNRKVLPSFFFINLYFFWSYSPNTSDG